MSITVGDNFSYQGGKPLDARFQFSSVANMKAFAEASLYDGCLAYIPSSKKYYTYDSSNTVDTTTGRWRELETGGGGGTSDYTDLTNKPQIESITLTGNQALASFGLTSSVATQLSGSSTKSYVSRGEKYDWNTCGIVYGTCSTSASTTAKSVTVSRGTFNFEAGARIAIKFSYNNTASAPTLTINSTTKNIKCIDENGSTYTPVIWWDANDIVEFIYDGTQFLMQPTTGMMFKIHGTTMPRESIYSTTEKVVGCWVDGRPIYQKTITDTLPSYTGSTHVLGDKSINIGASVLHLVKASGHIIGSTGVDTPLPIGVAQGTLSESNGLIYGYVRAVVRTNSAATNKNTIGITNGYANYNGVTFYLTLQYTKTTDAANSFKYGDPNDYSTTEKIVGSWIDGKPLYQKTITYTMPTISTDGTRTLGAYTSTGTTIKTVVDIQAIAYNSSGAYYELLNRSDKLEEATNSSRKYSRLFVMTNSASSNKNTVCVVANDSAFSGATAYITIKYTKS